MPSSQNEKKNLKTLAFADYCKLSYLKQAGDHETPILAHLQVLS